MFTALAALATATPDWCKADKRVHKSIAKRWQLEWQKVPFILRGSGQNSIDYRRITECFDFDRLSCSCLRGLVLSASKKKLFFVHRKIFQNVDPVQHQDVSSKGLLREFCQLQSFQVEIYLFFPPKSPTEIWKLTPQRRHSSELAASANFFWRRQRRVLSSYIHSTQLSNCIESISWAMLTWRPWF